MELHASNIAIIAGAKGGTAEKISKRLVKERNISVSRAKELMKTLFHRKRKIIVRKTVKVRVR